MKNESQTAPDVPVESGGLFSRVFRSEFYDEWNAWAINLPKLRIILIFQHPRYWEWIPRKCHIWDRKLNEWTGYHCGPFEISWENAKEHLPR